MKTSIALNGSYVRVGMGSTTENRLAENLLRTNILQIYQKSGPRVGEIRTMRMSAWGDLYATLQVSTVHQADCTRSKL